MASYIEGALIKDETVIYEGNISLWSLSPQIFAGGFLIILSVVFTVFMIVKGVVVAIWCGSALFIWAVAYIRYKTTELAFTNKRVIAKFGFISRKTIEINIGKVESIQVTQSILGRIFNFGTLVISGAGNPQAPIPGISDPIAFRRAFMESQHGANETKV